VDLCLIFKVLDIIEKKTHKNAEKILKAINAKRMIISFSTRTLSGKPMEYPRRLWAEKLFCEAQLSI